MNPSGERVTSVISRFVQQSRFEGLRAFKQKFDPVWTPHYLASPRGLGAPRVLYEMNGLISGGTIGVLRKG